MDGETLIMPAVTHARRVGAARDNNPPEDPAPRLQSMPPAQRPPNYFNPNGNPY